MKKWQRIVNKTEGLLFHSLPVVLFFSYYPTIRLGSNSSMNFELSLPLIWIAVLGILSLRKINTIITKAPRKELLISFLIPTFASLSLLWSYNPLRGFLTSGIIWLIFIIIWRLICEQAEARKKYIKLLHIYLAASVIVASFGILQSFLNVWGVPDHITLLCAGCGYSSFGFPHPNGFAIEPQFFGSLLLPPCIISIFILYKTIKSNRRKVDNIKAYLLCFYLIMSLYVIFSRGATFSLAIVAGTFLIITALRDRNNASLKVFSCGILAVLAATLMQGCLAQISPTNENFYDGIARSIHQMSLGKIDIRDKTTELGKTPQAPEDSSNESTPNSPQNVESSSSKFDGYIAESTNIRMELNRIAIDSWQSHKFLGVGLGGAGIALNKTNPKIQEKEIVQNEYLTILLELGLIGVVIIGLNLFLLLNFLLRRGDLFNILVIGAFALSLCFFSGLPNALHIYIIPCFLILGETRSKLLNS